MTSFMRSRDDPDFVREAVAKYWPAMGFAGGCVLQLAARYPREEVITTDLRHFRIYGRPAANRSVRYIRDHPDQSYGVRTAG